MAKSCVSLASWDVKEFAVGCKMLHRCYVVDVWTQTKKKIMMASQGDTGEQKEQNFENGCEPGG